ncbi:hypothetical protein [Sporosarcina sp. HYO08]|uniref:hypothetical protein n=1 Tax=Sporosarcina sp. HYO08 TaxID=1759557 RepID=UPI0007970006|nr:hypothetical protein [Sporosarcina sp. HYO08]KXH78807.1 hypothetical protein AU377_12465 [Sporosarcina sp. HYO08]
MAKVHIIDEKTLKIELSISDAISMVQEAAKDIRKYAKEIMAIYDAMPIFQYTHFCFYAFNNCAGLFEKMLSVDPKRYKSFSLDAPDSFFYSLYGGLAGLYEQAEKYITMEGQQDGSENVTCC